MNADCQYSQPGPCVPTSSMQTALEVGSVMSPLRLDLRATIPCDTNGGFTPPYPTIIFFNGFQARMEYYVAYAQLLASWGFVVLQYNLPLFRIVKDAAEIQCLEPLLAWLAEQNAAAGSQLHGRVALDRLGVAGHSRGAKLAALHFADGADSARRVKAAALIDPVDNTGFTPESADYPSAVRALRRAGRPLAITGAGVVGRCNPPGSNYKEFWGAAPGKSWLTVVRRSSHTEFLDAGRLLNIAIAALCGCKGRNSCQETLRLTAPPLLAWMDSQLRGSEHADARRQGFLRFMDAEEAAGTVSFSIKPGTTRSTDEQPGLELLEGAGLSGRAAGAGAHDRG